MTIPKLADATNPFGSFNIFPNQTSDTISRPAAALIQENFLKHVQEKNFSQALQLSGQVSITSDILLVAYSPKTPQSLRNILTPRVKSELTEKKAWQSALSLACENNEADLVKELLGDYALGSRYDFVKEKDSLGNTPLHIAAGNGHSDTCTALLAPFTLEEQKSMLEVEDNEDEYTPLHLAALNGHSGTCTTLLTRFTKEEQKNMLEEKGDESQYTPLHCAALNGHGDTCTALLAGFTREEQKNMLKEKNHEGGTPLHLAALGGYSDTCTALLAGFTQEEQKSMLKEKDADGDTPLHWAVRKGHSGTCTTLLAGFTREEQKSMLKEKNNAGDIPLHRAAQSGHSDACNTLLAGFSLDEQKSMLEEKDAVGDTPLHRAATNGHSDTCTTLIAVFSPEEQKSMLKEKGLVGNTPLHYASLNGQSSTCITLLAVFSLEEQKSMLKEKNDEGDTPLRLAAAKGHSDTCTTLLAVFTLEEQKSMLREKNNLGDTPFHLAAAKGHDDACTTLLAVFTLDEQRSMLREKNVEGYTPLHLAALKGQSSTCTTLLAVFTLEEQQLILNDKIFQIFYFKNYIKRCKHPFLSSIKYRGDYTTLFNILHAFPENVCKEHPRYNPLKIAFIFRNQSLTEGIQSHLRPEQFWTYLHALIEEDPKLAPYIADTFFSIDRAHLQMGSAKKKTEPLNSVDSDFIKCPHAKESQEVTVLVEYMVQSIPHFPKEFDTAEKQREHLYPMIKQFATYLSLFDTINWTNPSEKGYIAVDSLTIEPPMGESHAPASDVLIPHLKKGLVTLLYNVFFKHPFLGTPTAGTPYLKDFYEEIEHKLCHLLKNFIIVDHEDSVAMKKRNRSLITLAEAGAHCGGRYATNVDEEYRTHCLKQSSSFESSLYNDLCTTRRTLLDTMNQSRNVTDGNEHLFYLGPLLGITHSPFKDPAFGLDKCKPAQIAQKKKNYLNLFLSQYTPSITLQNTSMMLTCQKMKDAFVDWASDPEKKLFSTDAWTEDLQGQVQSLENHMVVSCYTEPVEKIAKKTGELEELLKENEDKDVYKRPKETGMQAVLSAIRAHISQKWIAKIEGDRVVIQPYAELRTLYELKVIKLLSA